MAKIRSIKMEFWLDEKIGSLPPEARLLYIGTWSLADDNGVLRAFEQRRLVSLTNKMFVKPGLMPHRIRITDVRVERLHDISDEDCLREGVQFLPEINRYYFECTGCEGFYFDYPREAFASLIDKVSGRGTWDSNPWVFVYEFELIR